MKPFVVDQSALHFKLAKLGGVKVKKEHVSVWNPATTSHAHAVQYRLSCPDFCTYWRRVVWGSVIGLCMTVCATLFITPILAFAARFSIPYVHFLK